MKQIRSSVVRRLGVGAGAVALVISFTFPAAAANAAPAPARAATVAKVLSVAPAAVAEGVPPAPPTPTQPAAGATVDLVASCSNLSAQAKADIATYSPGLCGIQGLAKTANALPAVTTIHCGYASIKDEYADGGQTDLVWTITTTVGEMISRDLVIVWNGSNGSAGSFLDISPMLTGHYVSNPLLINSGFSAYASFSGSVLIWDGVTCYANNIHN